MVGVVGNVGNVGVFGVVGVVGVVGVGRGCQGERAGWGRSGRGLRCSGAGGWRRRETMQICRADNIKLMGFLAHYGFHLTLNAGRRPCPHSETEFTTTMMAQE